MVALGCATGAIKTISAHPYAASAESRFESALERAIRLAPPWTPWGKLLRLAGAAFGARRCAISLQSWRRASAKPISHRLLAPNCAVAIVAVASAWPPPVRGVGGVHALRSPQPRGDPNDDPRSNGSPCRTALVFSAAGTPVLGLRDHFEFTMLFSPRQTP